MTYIGETVGCWSAAREENDVEEIDFSEISCYLNLPLNDVAQFALLYKISLKNSLFYLKVTFTVFFFLSFVMVTVFLCSIELMLERVDLKISCIQMQFLYNVLLMNVRIKI